MLNLRKLRKNRSNEVGENKPMLIKREKRKRIKYNMEKLFSPQF